MPAPNFKPPRGYYILEREAEKADALRVEREQKAKTRKRDGRCRWPEDHVCRGELESAHIRDASLGGEMSAQNLITLCAWIHRRGPESIHGKQLKVESLTVDGANGPLSFWRKDAQGAFYVVAQERAIGMVERD